MKQFRIKVVILLITLSSSVTAVQGTDPFVAQQKQQGESAEWSPFGCGSPVGPCH